MEELIFDDERATPSLYFENKELFYYHLSRYQFATNIIEKNDTVVDIACGTGYGAYELASKCKMVYGIDLSEKALTYAKNRFNSFNITFIKENAISFGQKLSEKVNAVISFETIEHLSEKDQGLFLENVINVLDSDGVFIVSTPNKDVYSKHGISTNEFHKKELSIAEFEDILKSKFKTVLLFGQKLNSGYSLKRTTMQIGRLIKSIFTLNFKLFKTGNDLTIALSDFEFTSIDLKNSLIIIAICKNPI